MLLPPGAVMLRSAKRRREAAAERTGGLPKRVCLGPVVCPQVIDIAMETSWTPPPTPPQLELLQQQQTHSTSMTQLPAHCCPRCLAGEPGHISHILGLMA